MAQSDKTHGGEKTGGSEPNGGANPASDMFVEMLRMQGEAARQVMASVMPEAANRLPDQHAITAMGSAMLDWQRMWTQLPFQQAAPGLPASMMTDPLQWMDFARGWLNSLSALDADAQKKMWEEGFRLWEDVLGQYGLAGDSSTSTILEPHLPRQDRRFSDPAWRQHPVFALIHQTYLLFAERIGEAVETLDGLSDSERDNLRFATRTALDALSPANFPLMNPVVLERTIETRGQNLAKGMARLAGDIERGQLTHTDTSKFILGENIACTPGKVVHEEELFQVIQYAPATKDVVETPLVIFPPWINRFYILDLNPRKSFVKWAVDQGVTVFMVSWRSADESLRHVEWDDYIKAQMTVIDLARERLNVPSVHAIGYCVGGTTLAATLAILARRGEADKVASATFLTAQVDFEHAGDLKLFIGDQQLEMVRQASEGGFLDGRYMAATFNMLRGSDLIWNYVVNHYLLGEDYPAFDLLYWNGDTTNLPARWHSSYLRDMYRDNLLVAPDALSADGTAIDLSLVKTPCYVQAGREDHIAPPASVYRLKDHLSGPARFVLAGSGHIAGVVNPPAAGKYQYWTNDKASETLDEFLAGATEHKGSWWPDWLKWIESQNGGRTAARGKRKPGGKGDRVLEDAPGRYVAMR